MKLGKWEAGVLGCWYVYNKDKPSDLALAYFKEEKDADLFIAAKSDHCECPGCLKPIVMKYCKDHAKQLVHQDWFNVIIRR